MYGELFGLITAWSWAISNIYTKQATNRLSPLKVLTAYLWIYTLLTLFVAFFMGRLGGIFRLPFDTVAYFTSGSVLGFGGDWTLFKAFSVGGGVGYTITTATSIFIFTTAVIGTLFLNESISVLQISAGLMIIIGIFIANCKPSIRSFTLAKISSFSFNESVFIFASTTGFLWALGLVLWNQGLSETDPITGAAISNLIPSGVFILICIFNSKIRPFPVEPLYFWKLFMGGSLYGLGLLTSILALEASGIGLTAILMSSTPIFSIPLGIWFLKEQYTKQGMAGLGICILGIIIAVI